MNYDKLINRADDVAEFLAVIASRWRLLILMQLISGEMCVGEIGKAINLGSSSLSQHLRKLRESGMVKARREGQTLYYSCASHETEQFLLSLGALFPYSLTPAVNAMKNSEKSGWLV